MKQEYEAIIGLEIHLRLNTKTKMFCGTTNSDAEEPNIYTCPICLGHPGTLPQVNNEAIRLGTLLALGLNCTVASYTKFDRKNYFYPDLPKGYQISQFDQPLATHGFIEILPDDITTKHIRIERLHLEEDTAKLKHTKDGSTLADFNRAGAPLVELVTQPDLRSSQEAKMFAQELQQIARYIGAGTADMEKGEMRCDVNVSLRPMGDTALYPKTEIKNVNSFRSIERAINYEIERQAALWDKFEAPQTTTTMGWDDQREMTIEQRTKEGIADYRYFPEPDIPPIVRTNEEIEQLREHLPELPYAKRLRFVNEFELSFYDARVLTADPLVAEFFENIISELRGWLNSLDDTEGSDKEIWKKYRKKLGRITTSWITSELFKLMKEKGNAMQEVSITPENFAELLTLIYEKRINSSAGQKILRVMYENGGDPSQIMAEHNLEQMSDTGDIEVVVDRIITANPSVVADYKNGKQKALMFLVGQVMKETKGKVNPEIATEMLTGKLRDQ